MTVDTQPAVKTPFYDFHVAAGARMVEFAGFLMPVQYKGIVAEHKAVRDKVGLFDLSHMGEFLVAGSDALTFLQMMTTNDVAQLEPGQIQYSCLPHDEGGIVDDLLVYRMSEDEFLLVVNASNMAKDFAWLHSHLSGEVTLEDQSAGLGLLAIQGPKAQKVMAELTDHDLEAMPYYAHVTTDVAGVELMFSRTGYTGEDGFELYIPTEHCTHVWEKVVAAGETHNMEFVGLGARDTLRLEMKMCLYGNDIDETTSPVEAGLSWIVHWEKDFVGKDIIARHKEEKPKRRLVCLETEERMVPRTGCEIFDGDQRIGTVTSGTFSPSLEKPIALGYVVRKKAKAGSLVEIEIRGKRISAQVVKPPFYKNASHR